jgi:Tfp pilus assembly protein PilF
MMPRSREEAGRSKAGTPSKRTRPAWLPVLVVFLLAFLIRVIYVLQQRANPQFASPLLDPAYHDEWAWQLASGTWKPDGPFFRAPFYPLFLAGIYKLAGHDFLTPRLVQALLGSLSCVLTCLIGTRLFSRSVGLLAGLGAALYGTLIYFDAELQLPVLLLLLILGFFLALLLAFDAGTGKTIAVRPQPQPKAATDASAAISPTASARRQTVRAPLAWSALAGAGFGLATITHPPVASFLPGLAWAFWDRVKHGFPWMAVAAFILVALIPVGVVTLYNATAGGDFVIIASQGGVNFYIGNNELSDGKTAIVPGTRPDWWGGRFDTIKIAERELGRSLKDSEVSRYWFRKALTYITTHPLQWIGLTARKFGLFWLAPEIGNNESIPHTRSYSAVGRLPLLGFGLVAPLGLAGIILALRQRRRAALLPLLWIIFLMLGVIAFFVCGRYRVPTVPFLLIFAAFAVAEGVAAWRRGERRLLRWPALVFLLALIAVNVPALGHKENLAQARYHDGVAWRQKGNAAEAERAFRDALAMDPNVVGAQENLANILAERGDRRGAGQAYEQAVAASPRDPKALANLASFQLNAGDLAAAEATAQRALAIDPDHSEALRILGVVREQRGDLAGARDAYERALRFTREQPRLENNLAGLDMREGRLAEAEVRLRRAVELDPEYALAWTNLGVLYVNSERLDDAVTALQRATELQPNSQQAWLQLAEVLRQLGRTAEAERAQQRAGQVGRRN